MAIRHDLRPGRRCGYLQVNGVLQGFKSCPPCGNLINVIDVAYASDKTYRRRHKEELQMRSKLHMVYGVFEVDS